MRASPPARDRKRRGPSRALRCVTAELAFPEPQSPLIPILANATMASVREETPSAR
jgi:hypothetical protein